MDTVSLEPLTATPGPGQHLGKPDVEIVREMLERHVKYTGSPKAKEVLRDWNSLRMKFVKVLPHEYRRALMEAESAAKVA